jgi:Mg2+ and Co2+ transporter CorA
MPESQLAKSAASGIASASLRTPVGDTEQVIAALVDATGILLPANAGDVQQRMTAGRFFWFDVSTTDATARNSMVAQLGLEDADCSWILRFGQAPRMTILPKSVRIVTKVISPEDQSAEMHVLWTGAWVVTVWAGNAALLQDIRQRFATRLSETHETAFVSWTILLLLLLSTIGESVTRAYAQVYVLEESLDGSTTADLNSLRRLRRRVLKESLHADRYSAAVGRAVVGVDIMPGSDAKGAALMKEYVDQVEDLSHRLESLAELLRAVGDEIAAIPARRQSLRINQLTVVTAIFLPVTFLTGFFGMNFQWMIDRLGSREIFLVLAVALPVAMMAATVLLFAHEGFIRRRRSDGNH